MVITEIITIDNKEYKYSYSDQGFMITRDGVEYANAIDPIGFDRDYIETDEKIEEPDSNLRTEAEADVLIEENTPKEDVEEV